MPPIKEAVAALAFLVILSFASCETLSKFQQTDIEATSWAVSGVKQGRQVAIEIE